MAKNPTPEFKSILDEAPTEVTPPKPMPRGTYLATVGNWEEGEPDGENSGFVEFTFTLTQPMDDVDAGELEEAGGLDGGRPMRKRFWSDTNSIWALDSFHEHCGLDLGKKQKRRTRNDAVMNSQVLVYVDHQQSKKNKDRVYAQIVKTAPVE